MIRIAIDGPGGAGKSSLAKAVAQKLGIIYVDTGALYRTIGYHMVSTGIDPKDRDKVIPALDTLMLEMDYVDGKQLIRLNGEDVMDKIRTPEISMAASNVSAIKEVRDYLLNTQRNIAKKNSVIMDGRDIGTVILPNAEVKIFLTASPEARATRRFQELKAKGQEVTYEQVYNEMVERDTNDSTRDIAPCIPSSDAVLLDNSSMSEEETLNAVVKIIKARSPKKTFYMKAHFCLARLVRFIFKAKADGVENIPKEGGYIICANHIAVRDVLVIGATCPRQIKFIAKKELFSIPILRGILKALGAVKLDRNGNDIAALRKSVDILDEGDIVSIFPQGHRNPSVDPSTTEIKNGAGLLAYRSGCDVIPVYIKTKGNKYGIFKKVTVIYGKVIKNSEFNFAKGGSDEYYRATKKIFNAILELGGYNETAQESLGEKNIEN